ncbi:MAG: hypothetical protein KDA84_06485, partial [Planctomycetaceae bacterium]|nr:hypothetical protein [Planctomycetaceae bacterium]
ATESGETLGEAGGLLQMSDAQLGNLGRSGSFVGISDAALDPHDPHRVDQAYANTEMAHPLRSNKFPFEIELLVNGNPVRLDFKDIPAVNGQGLLRSECKLQVSKGDRVAIKVRSNYLVPSPKNQQINVVDKAANRVGMRLLIDGFNSLGQKRSLLDDGRLWVLEQGENYKIDGYYVPLADPTPGGKNYKHIPFKIVDVDKSVAARESFTDQIGLISFAFFENAGRGVAFGEDGQNITEEKLKPVSFLRGRCLAVFHIRYVEAE